MFLLQVDSVSQKSWWSDHCIDGSLFDSNMNQSYLIIVVRNGCNGFESQAVTYSICNFLRVAIHINIRSLKEVLCRERWQVRNGPNCYRQCWLFDFLHGLNLRLSGKGSRHRWRRQWRHHDTHVLRSVFRDLYILLVIHGDMLLVFLLLLSLFVFRCCACCDRDVTFCHRRVLLHAFSVLLVFLPFSIPPRASLPNEEDEWSLQIVKYFSFSQNVQIRTGFSWTFQRVHVEERKALERGPGGVKSRVSQVQHYCTVLS